MASGEELKAGDVVKEPPPYDGNYSDQLLDPFKQVHTVLSLIMYEIN